MVIAGIDYSYTSPAICVYDDSKDFSIKNVKIFNLTSLKKCHHIFLDGMIRCEPLPDEPSGVEKFSKISTWALDILTANDVSEVHIEDYAFSATGKVFHIGENTGILKYRLNKAKIHCETCVPQKAKKIATGKGNAKKVDVINAFNEELGLNLREIMGLTEKQDNPISDLADAYYIAKYGASQQ